MTKLTYAEQLAHPKWQRRRLEMLNTAGWACATCGNEDKQLHVHHRAYFKGRMAWDYADHELAVLCSTCHSDEHDAKELLDQLLLSVPIERAPIQEALSLLLGFFPMDSDESFHRAHGIATASQNFGGRFLGPVGFIASMIADLPPEAQVELMKNINAIRVREGLDER